MDPVTELYPGVRRLLAPNPSMMTGPGTNTYLFGDDIVAVVDPGPIIPEHIERIQQLAPRIGWVLATHTHPDHSPGARMLAERTDAQLLGMPAPDGPHQDHTFRPDRVLADADVLEPCIQPCLLSPRGNRLAVHRRPCHRRFYGRHQPTGR